MSAERADGAKAHIIQLAERTSRRLNQAIGKGIVQVQPGRVSRVLIGSNRAGVLIKTLRTVTEQAIGARTSLAVEDAIAAAQHRFRSELIRQAKTRLNVGPVR